MYEKGFTCIHQNLISVRKKVSGFNFLQLSSLMFIIINKNITKIQMNKLGKVVYLKRRDIVRP